MGILDKTRVTIKLSIPPSAIMKMAPSKSLNKSFLFRFPNFGMRINWGQIVSKLKLYLRARAGNDPSACFHNHGAPTTALF